MNDLSILVQQALDEVTGVGDLAALDEIRVRWLGKKGTLYRWGGDEFAVCLPDFSTEEALATAERISAGGPPRNTVNGNGSFRASAIA